MRILLIALTPIFTAGSLCFGFMPGLQQVALIVLGLRARGQTARFHSRGVLLSAFSHVAWFPLYAAASAVLPDDALSVVGAAACASLIHAAILAPYSLFVPAHLTTPTPDRTKAAGRPFPMPSLDQALAQWDRLSWTWRFALLTARVVPVVASFALFFVCRLWVSWRISFTLASFAYGLGVFAYAEAAAAAHVKTWKPDEVPAASARYLTLPALGCVLLGVVLFAYGLVAATEPSPMTVYDGSFHATSLPVPLHPILHPGGLPITDEGVNLPGTDVHLQPFPGGVSVRTADGGGAGRTLALSPYERGPDTLSELTWVEETEDGFEIYQQQDGWRYFTIDRAGIRTEDGLARRLRHGLGLSALSLFGAGLLLIILSVWLLTSAARIRRRLGAIRSVQELESPECMGAIEGTFHGKAHNVSAVEARKITQVKGEGEVRAHLGGGILRFRLPTEGTQSIGVPKDGQTVTLTGVFPKLGAQFREAATAWPSDALLLAGDKAATADGLLKRAVRPAMLVLLGANILWVSALFSAFAHRL